MLSLVVVFFWWWEMTWLLTSLLFKMRRFFIYKMSTAPSWGDTQWFSWIFTLWFECYAYYGASNCVSCTFLLLLLSSCFRMCTICCFAHDSGIRSYCLNHKVSDTELLYMGHLSKWAVSYVSYNSLSMNDLRFDPSRSWLMKSSMLTTSNWGSIQIFCWHR